MKVKKRVGHDALSIEFKQGKESCRLRVSRHGWSIRATEGLSKFAQQLGEEWKQRVRQPLTYGQHFEQLEQKYGRG